MSEPTTVVHRAGVVKTDVGYIASCSCGWRARYTSPVAAHRDVKGHRRHPDRPLPPGLDR